ncbi:hypothetical protein LX64_00969 [Chitinophaga skermanii]|uniref:DUF6249 domain-containing protein n=1 Tax=Chitinophaga skermanii TaxID=331697 RepID=A0A327QVH2_9BACT|nr:DUF6249 domain-containing protein [Chitinophaga skermanii]RAJ08321.1 hypothetical protein LX64_00969 [Chitinophaga skermanii]
MDPKVLFAWAIILFVVFSFAVVAYYCWLKHRERLELIRKGDFVFQGNYMDNLKYSMLGKGVILLSVALGLTIGYITTNGMKGEDTIIPYLISITGCAGLGMLCYYFLLKKKAE